MTAASQFDQLVFSGGGTRCFWHGGFLAEVREVLALKPERVTGVSGGALSAACFLSGRGHKLLQVMGGTFDKIDHNVQLDGVLHGEGITPHERAYRQIVSETLDPEAIEAIAEGPVFEVLLAHPPTKILPKWSTIPVMLAYELELAVRSTPHMHWPSLLGVKQDLVDARQAARDGRLVDLICNAAVIPPVFNVARWDGQQVIDGGMASKAPVPSEDAGRTLILLTRRYRNLPQSNRRVYVMPEHATPADKMDFTSREKIEQTWACGRQDGQKFLRELGLSPAQAQTS